MKYLVRDCDPNTGEPDDDGYDDEYVVSEFLKVPLDKNKYKNTDLLTQSFDFLFSWKI